MPLRYYIGMTPKGRTSKLRNNIWRALQRPLTHITFQSKLLMQTSLIAHGSIETLDRLSLGKQPEDVKDRQLSISITTRLMDAY